MAIVKLCDVIGTKYMINAINGLFRNTMDKLVGMDDVLDLADCRFGPKCEAILREYYSKIQMCNTEDEVLDKMLKNNCGPASEKVEDYEILDLSNTKSIDTALTLINSLPSSAKYTVNVNLSAPLDKITTILLIMARSDIEFDISRCATDIFDFVRESWLSSAKSHDSYYELNAPHVQLVKRNKDGKFGDDSYGYMSEDIFIRRRIVVPAEFGNSQIIVLDENIEVDEEWMPVVEKCMNTVDMLTASENRVPGKTLKNYLTFREV